MERDAFRKINQSYKIEKLNWSSSRLIVGWKLTVDDRWGEADAYTVGIYIGDVRDLGNFL